MRQSITALVLTSTITSIAGADAWKFQAETVPWETQTQGQQLVELVHRTADAASTHALIRFDRPPTALQRSLLLDAGLIVERPLGGASYTARIDPARLDPASVLAAANVQEILDLQPQWKLHRSLAEGEVPRWTLTGANARAANPNVPVYVMFHPISDDAALVIDSDEALAIADGRVVSTMPSIDAVVAILPFESIWTLIEDDRVLYVEPALPQFSTTNASNRVITQVDDVQAAPYNLDGSGVSVMVYDGGHAAVHGDFGNRLTVRDNSGTSNHGTHVSGTIGGDGSGSGGAV